MALPRLKQLNLYEVATGAAAAYEPLNFLPALEHLLLWSCAELPACLPRLPALRLLRIRETPAAWMHDDDLDEEGVADEVNAALVPLTGQLTGLELSCGYLRTRMPPALSAFSCLEGLALGIRHSVALPTNAGGTALWLRNLRWAAFSVRTVASNLTALAATTQLESLAVNDFTAINSVRPALLSVLSWAAQHPSLRHLEVYHSGPASTIPARDAEDDPDVQAAAPQARQAKPALIIDFGFRFWHKLTQRELD